MSDQTQEQSRTASAASLIQPSSESSAANVVLFLLAAILIFGGFWVMSIAFGLAEEIAGWIFAAGLMLDVLGFWLAFGIIPNKGNGLR